MPSPDPFVVSKMNAVSVGASTAAPATKDVPVAGASVATTAPSLP